MKYLLLFLLPLFVLANDLRDIKKEELELKREKGFIEATLLRDSWINPLVINGSLYKSNVNDKDADYSKSIGVSLSQDIFKSGAIWYQREQSKLQNRINQKSIDYEYQEMTISVYELVLALRILDLKLIQLGLAVENKNIEIEGKKEKYNNGVVDISELDTAILELSELKNSIESLHMEKESYKTELGFLSDKSYKQIKLSKIKVLSQKEFLSLNHVHIQKDVISYNHLAKKIVDATYLPKVSVESTYKYDDSKYSRNIRDDKNSWEYGLSVSLPLDFNTDKMKQIAQKELLLSKIRYKSNQDNEKIFYQNMLYKVTFLERKIKNNQEAKITYDSLITQVDDLYQNGLKTVEDLTVLKNTKESKMQEILIDKLSIRLELLKLYKRLVRWI